MRLMKLKNKNTTDYIFNEQIRQVLNDLYTYKYQIIMVRFN